MTSPMPHPRELLPHSAPMILIDEVLGYVNGVCTCEVRIGEQTLFLEDGKVPALVALEYMAQSIGAYAGLEARARGEARPLGFLLGSRDMSLGVPHFEVGDVLRVEVTRIWGGDQLGTFRCAVYRGEQKVASGDLNVYRADEGQIP